MSGSHPAATSHTSTTEVIAMQLDRLTLADLEVFESTDGRAGLIALLDHTRTEAGARALRRRIRGPATASGDILAAQDAVEALAALERPIRLDDRVMRAAEGHLSSRIVMVRGDGPAAWVEAAWIHLRYRDVLREIRAGVDSVRALSHLAGRVMSRLDDHADGVLGGLRERVEAMVECLGRPLGMRRLLRADSLIRGELADRVRDGISALGELDALQSLALATDRPGWSRPEVVESEEFLLEADGAVHPLLEGGRPNPIRLGGGQPLVFLTGPNMAGKTTYLRTVALLVLLAQLGARVPATSARWTPVDAVLTSLNPADNLRAGVSYFMAEVLRVREAAALLADGRRALILFDEVFKGTNVKDALDASTLVLQGFSRSRRAGAIFSSHLSELAETLGSNPAIRLRRFEGDVVEGTPRFTFRLESGVSDRRLGMLLLRQAGVPDLIAAIAEGTPGGGSPASTP